MALHGRATFWKWIVLSCQIPERLCPGRLRVDSVLLHGSESSSTSVGMKEGRVELALRQRIPFRNHSLLPGDCGCVFDVVIELLVHQSFPREKPEAAPWVT